MPTERPAELRKQRVRTKQREKAHKHLRKRRLKLWVQLKLTQTSSGNSGSEYDLTKRIDRRAPETKGPNETAGEGSQASTQKKA
ncbi:hypothetical protein O181_022191 [Austropuccinia psidii MF-1]|uniref:Uncharacterized protein n=1 Tax=Austropuccinia psidii MF-1 TaxID=1389203 RepID=A0A9Q3CCD2_9BASI|nr:hypothetical protein [Austropuccinia psidii MF-1]